MFQLNLRANAELVPEFHVALHASHAAIPQINFKIFIKMQPSECDQNSAQMFNFCPLLHTPNSPLSIPIPSSLPNVLPCYQPNFTRRAMGHCLETVRATSFSDFPHCLL
jgi:hypothetical protein